MTLWLYRFKQWFLFDDETVSKLELIKTPIQKPSKRARSATPLSPVVKNDQSNKQHNGKGKTIDLTSSDSESDAPYVRSSPYKQSSLEVPRPCGSSKSAAKKRKVEDDSDMEENRVATDEYVVASTQSDAALTLATTAL